MSVRTVLLTALTAAQAEPPFLGQTWTAATSGTTQNLNAIVFHPKSGKLFAVGNAGTILTSPDGYAWTPVASGTVQNLSAVACSQAMDWVVEVAGAQGYRGGTNFSGGYSASSEGGLWCSGDLGQSQYGRGAYVSILRDTPGRVMRQGQKAPNDSATAILDTFLPNCIFLDYSLRAYDNQGSFNQVAKVMSGAGVTATNQGSLGDGPIAAYGEGFFYTESTFYKSGVYALGSGTVNGSPVIAQVHASNTDRAPLPGNAGTILGRALSVFADNTFVAFGYEGGQHRLWVRPTPATPLGEIRKVVPPTPQMLTSAAKFNYLGQDRIVCVGNSGTILVSSA